MSLPEPSRHVKPSILGCLVCLSGPTRRLKLVRGGTSRGLQEYDRWSPRGRQSLLHSSPPASPFQPRSSDPGVFGLFRRTLQSHSVVRDWTSWGLKSSKCDVFIDVLSFQTRTIRHFEPPGAFQTRKIRLILPPRAFHSQNQANVKYLSTF